MEDTIKTTRIDVDKVAKIFDEILTFILDTDNRDTQDDCLNRVKVADLVLQLASEIIERMMCLTTIHPADTGWTETIEELTLFNDTIIRLQNIQQFTDILQG